MNSPQDRIIKKMIDNIVEQHKPVFEKPAVEHHTPSTHAPAAAALQPEDYNLISRKLEYGFNTMRQENAELRKAIEELAGMMKMLRNDMDSMRMQHRQAREAPVEHHKVEAPVNVPPTGMGAPQYRKTAADEEFEGKHGEGAIPAHDAPIQARGFAKKDPAADAGVDISKVFYYGKK